VDLYSYCHFSGYVATLSRGWAHVFGVHRALRLSGGWVDILGKDSVTIFGPEDSGSMFLQSVGVHVPDYTVSQC
jgi:hypothetical protein